MKKLLAVLFTFVVCVLVYYGLSRYWNRPGIYYQIASEYNAATKDLKKERLQLVDKIQDLEDDFSVSNLGSVIIFLSDDNLSHLKTTVTKIDENGYHGVIAVSKSMLEDTDNYMSKTDLESLMNKNYEIVIELTKDDDPSELYKYFVLEGLDPKGFYIVGDVSEDIINKIKQTDCNVVIGNPYNVTDEDIFYICKYGNRYPSIKTKFKESVSNSTTIALSIGYSGVIYEQYEEDVIDSMFKTLTSHVEDDLTLICNITEAVYRKEYLDAYLEEYYASQNAEISRCKERIEQIDKEILDLSK